MNPKRSSFTRTAGGLGLLDIAASARAAPIPAAREMTNRKRAGFMASMLPARLAPRKRGGSGLRKRSCLLVSFGDEASSICSQPNRVAARRQRAQRRGEQTLRRLDAAPDR